MPHRNSETMLSRREPALVSKDMPCCPRNNRCGSIEKLTKSPRTTVAKKCSCRHTCQASRHVLRCRTDWPNRTGTTYGMTLKRKKNRPKAEACEANPPYSSDRVLLRKHHVARACVRVAIQLTGQTALESLQQHTTAGLAKPT